MQSKSPEAIQGVILAGGQSRRMGTDKALLDWQGKTLLAAKVAQLSAVLQSSVFVSGSYSGFECIADEAKSLGPLAGIKSTVKTLECEACVFIPVDMPLLSDGVIEHLLSLYETNKQSYYCRSSVFPLVLEVNQATIQCIDEVLARPEAKQRSIKALLTLINAQAVQFSEAFTNTLVNTNTPEQWQMIKHISGEQP
ncbi:MULTISPECIES: molybdenum cofactor guanylyltransferase [unclassified Agarivorans]|uniref:molybdenum cofactor guanylyltransferase n=1 Tax=unclassified Agarivorans TaxID=2636026 RepID=UPI0026E2309D|nr:MULTISPECIES: molybdenum cofactor guanylyltransferase [unclassified Agarivorans]MDO6686029.1 molybdenum cofactor guanylyltransferase [Agarivorans sp. 3_MG-2023]MDO6713833.1 molybdenum cofactor guanylyltransferase [Agarivorans sp. 2_MG-2023]